MKKNFLLLILLFVAFIDWMGVGLIYPMFSSLLFNKEMAIVAAEVSDVARGIYLGFLLALMPLTQFFSAPILGTLSDGKGRRRVLMACLWIGIAGYIAAVYGMHTESLFWLMASRAILGISAGSAAVVGAAIADLSSPSEKAKNFGLLNMACGVGFTVGPFLGGQLMALGQEAPFWASLGMVVLSLGLVYFFLEETFPAVKAVKATLGAGLKNLRKAVRIPALRAMFLSALFFAFGWSFYWEFVTVNWIAKYGMGPVEIGQVYAYAAGFYALSSGLLIRPVVKRVRPVVVMFVSLCFAGPYILLSLWHFPKNYFWAYLPLQQYSIAFLFPTLAAYVSNWASDETQGEMMGILQSVESFAFAASPLVAGIFVGMNPNMPIVVGGSMMLLAALILGVFLRKEIFQRS